MAFRSALDYEKEDETNYLLEKAKGPGENPYDGGKDCQTEMMCRTSRDPNHHTASSLTDQGSPRLGRGERGPAKAHQRASMQAETVRNGLKPHGACA